MNQDKSNIQRKDFQMEILDEKKMSSGETLRVLHWCSSEKAPEKYVDYVLASMGSDSPHEHLYSISGWRAYFSDAMLRRSSAISEETPSGPRPKAVLLHSIILRTAATGAFRTGSTTHHVRFLPMSQGKKYL